MKIIYGTGNINKLKEMQELLKDTNIELISLKDINFSKEIDENGETFFENSMIKAKAIQTFCLKNKIDLPILTDDAGLCVKALNNNPGVHTARYAGDHAPQIVCLEKLMKDLLNVEDREATFHCVLTFLKDDLCFQVEGLKKGQISTKIGKLGGLTFSPVFIPDGYNLPYSELENVETHRHDALNKLIAKLKELKIIA